ncbi:MAG: DNA methyltransferase [Gemmataceae bacterium]
MRAWALQQFARLDELATRTDIDLADRQMLAAFVEKIEVNPDTKTGMVYLHAGHEQAFADGSTRLPGGDFMGAFEIAFYGWKEGAGHLFLGPNNVTDLWHVKKVNPQSMIHLTEKPVELAVRAMQYSSRAGENVIDLFGGSGSTLIAAEQTGRKAFLMEIDPLYCDMICERWCKFIGKEAIHVDPQGNQTTQSELLVGRA